MVPAACVRGDRYCRPRALAIERQAHGDAGALADPAADVDFAAVQPHQTLDDGKSETGAAVAAVIGARGLKIRLADARQIFVADADAVVLDHEDDDSPPRRARRSSPCRRGR